MKFIAFLFLTAALAAPAPAVELAKPTENVSIRNEVQLAIDKGLRWLQQAQSADGSWSAPEQPALTALPLTAFLGAPDGKYKKEKPEFIEKGFQALLGAVQPDGGIYRKGMKNYNTSLSMLALASSGDARFEKVISTAREYVIAQQAKGLPKPALDGGIGYGPGGTNREHPDLSNTVMSLEALYRTKILTGKELASAKDLDWQALIGFVERCQNLPSHNKEPWASDDEANKGGFVYFPGHSMAGEMELGEGRKALRSYGSMSYAGLLSYIYADLKKEDPRVVAVVDWLRKHYTLEENPGMGADGLYYYYHMMAKALATYDINELEMADGKKVDWRKELALKLINLQKADGSWANESGRWMEKDPVLVTSYSLFALEILHRLL